MHKNEALKAAKALGQALWALNAADGELAVQAPATPFSKVSNSLKEVYRVVAIEEGYHPDYAKEIADRAYQVWLDGIEGDTAFYLGVSDCNAAHNIQVVNGWEV